MDVEEICETIDPKYYKWKNTAPASLTGEDNNFMVTVRWEDATTYNIHPEKLLQLGLTYVSEGSCQFAMQNGVKVVVSYEDATATKIEKLKRTTFAGMLSTLGTCASERALQWDI